MAFHNRCGVGESVKRSDLNVTVERLDINVAYGAKGNSATGLETVNQSLAFVAGAKLLLYRQYRFWKYLFALELTGIGNPVTKREVVLFLTVK